MEVFLEQMCLEMFLEDVPLIPHSILNIEYWLLILGLYLGVLLHGLLVLQKVVVGSSLLLIDIDDAIQVGEVPVQVDTLCIAAAHEPVLQVPRLRDENGQERQDDLQGQVTDGSRTCWSTWKLSICSPRGEL